MSKSRRKTILQPTLAKFKASGIQNIKQQRRGVQLYTRNDSDTDVDEEPDDRRESEESTSNWMEKVRRKSSVYAKKGAIIQEVSLPEHFLGLYSVRFSPDGEHIVLAFGSGAIQLRNNMGELVCNIRGAGVHGFPVMAIKFHPHNFETFYAASACGSVIQCQTKAGAYNRIIEEENNEINTLDINVAGDIMVTAGKDGAVRLYDTVTSKLMHAYIRPEHDFTVEGALLFHRMKVFCAKFHHIHDFTFLTGGWDDFVKIWDTRTESGCIRNIKGPHICGDAVDVRDDVVVTGSWTVSRSLQTWDMGSGKMIDTITPVNRPSSIDGEFLYAVQFFKGDNVGDLVLTGGSGTGMVEAISLRDKRVTTSFKTYKTIQAIDSNEIFAVFGGMESTMRIATIGI